MKLIVRLSKKWGNLNILSQTIAQGEKMKYSKAKVDFIRLHL